MRPVTALIVPLLFTITFLSGCAQKLLRENVLANTETLIGVGVSQSPTTRLYEARAGYARHELFLVPTSKRIAYDDEPDSVGSGGGSGGSNDPSSTPEVLGEIMSGGAIAVDGAASPIRVDVYQRLAVGRLAVQSPAAAALVSRDPATARATTDALAPLPPVTDQRLRLLEELDSLDRSALPPGALDTLARQRGYPDEINLRLRAPDSALQRFLLDARSQLSTPAP